VVEVPAAVVNALGSGRRPEVVITIGGHTWRSFFMRAIEDAQSPRTRHRRIAKLITTIGGGHAAWL
jgi:hypothetical protein